MTVTLTQPARARARSRVEDSGAAGDEPRGRVAEAAAAAFAARALGRADVLDSPAAFTPPHSIESDGRDIDDSVRDCRSVVLLGARRARCAVGVTQANYARVGRAQRAPGVGAWRRPFLL